MLAYSQEQGKRSRFKLSGPWPDCVCPRICHSLSPGPALAPLAQQHSFTLREVLQRPRRGHGCAGRSRAEQECIWMGQGQPLLVLAKAAYGERARVLLGTGTTTAPTPHQAPTSLLRHCPLLRWGCRCWEGKEQSHGGDGASLDLTLWATVPAGWCWPHWTEDKAQLTLGAGSSPSISAPLPPKVKAASTPWGKMWLMLMSEPTLWPKPPGTNILYRDAPTHCFKTRTGNCFT